MGTCNAYCVNDHKFIFFLYSASVIPVDNCDVLNDVLAAFWVILICCYVSALLAFAGSILGCAATCCAPPVGTLLS